MYNMVNTLLLFWKFQNYFSVFFLNLKMRRDSQRMIKTRRNLVFWGHKKCMF